MRASSLAFTATARWRNVPTLCLSRVQRPLRRHNHTHACEDTSSKRKCIRNFLEWKPEEEVGNVVVDGWVRSVRAMKKRAFITLGDGSSLAPLQAVIPGGDLQGYGFFSSPDRSYFY